MDFGDVISLEGGVKNVVFFEKFDWVLIGIKEFAQNLNLCWGIVYVKVLLNGFVVDDELSQREVDFRREVSQKTGVAGNGSSLDVKLYFKFSFVFEFPTGLKGVVGLNWSQGEVGGLIENLNQMVGIQDVFPHHVDGVSILIEGSNVSKCKVSGIPWMLNEKITKSQVPLEFEFEVCCTHQE